jgi:indoleamine 2,3-dioxygenase
MGSLESTGTTFQVLDDPRPDDMSLPAFMVSKARGFLPRMEPIVELPREFQALESLLDRMPVKTLSGEPGLLAQGKLGDAVLRELPDLTDLVDMFRDNLPLMNALYRDYCKSFWKTIFVSLSRSTSPDRPLHSVDKPRIITRN